MRYKIISSGSSGNCVIVDDMMFDVGVPYGSIKKELYKINYILITHTHSDHIKIGTVRKIKKEFPRIKWIGNWDIVSKVKVDYMVGDSTELKFKDRIIQSFPCVHDVPCHGYTVRKDGKSLIYATDTCSLEHAPKVKYDYLFLESNHDEKKIRAIQDVSKRLYGYDAYKGAMRHLSTQQSKAFYYMHRKDKDSPWIELHKSERFY